MLRHMRGAYRSGEDLRHPPGLTRPSVAPRARGRYGHAMAGTPFREVEEVLDRHARRLAGELGRLLIDVGQTLRKEAQASERPASKARTSESSREDLYREASKLGVKGR